MSIKKIEEKDKKDIEAVLKKESPIEVTETKNDAKEANPEDVKDDLVPSI